MTPKQTFAAATHLVNKARYAETVGLTSFSLASNFASRQHVTDAADSNVRAKEAWVQAVIMLLR